MLRGGLHWLRRHPALAMLFLFCLITALRTVVSAATAIRTGDSGYLIPPAIGWIALGLGLALAKLWRGRTR